MGRGSRGKRGKSPARGRGRGRGRPKTVPTTNDSDMPLDRFPMLLIPRLESIKLVVDVPEDQEAVAPTEPQPQETTSPNPNAATSTSAQPKDEATVSIAEFDCIPPEPKDIFVRETGSLHCSNEVASMTPNPAEIATLREVLPASPEPIVTESAYISDPESESAPLSHESNITAVLQIEPSPEPVESTYGHPITANSIASHGLSLVPGHESSESEMVVDPLQSEEEPAASTSLQATETTLVIASVPFQLIELGALAVNQMDCPEVTSTSPEPLYAASNSVPDSSPEPRFESSACEMVAEQIESSQGLLETFVCTSFHSHSTTHMSDSYATDDPITPRESGDSVANSKYLQAPEPLASTPLVEIACSSAIASLLIPGFETSESEMAVDQDQTESLVESDAVAATAPEAPEQSSNSDAEPLFCLGLEESGSEMVVDKPNSIPDHASATLDVPATATNVEVEVVQLPHPESNEIVPNPSESSSPVVVIPTSVPPAEVADNSELKFTDMLPTKPSELSSNKKVKPPQQEAETGSTIRRSSRIKKLETRRGGQRRREVVFSTTSEILNRSCPNIADEESSSSKSSNQKSSITSSVSTPNLNNPSEPGLFLSSPPRDVGGSAAGNVILSPSSLLKLKSRWRYSSDAESLGFSGAELLVMDNPDSKVNYSALLADASGVKTLDVEPSLHLVKRAGHIFYDPSDTELPDKLSKFQGLEENLFRSACRTISKESRGLLCDCYLTKEEISRGEIGCNENCLNRLLMVECGARCPTGDRCTNKKFQRKEYCKLEVFKTEQKGHGLRTRQSLSSGGFVIEYVGEVLDPREFGRRTKEYAKDNLEHFYFMALKSDSIIDATQRGNCSRFINHSCEPNCETQKWTVGGELRIGFFAIKDLAPGEEITFDYQFQRYGKEAQKCFCLTENCRGWIGGDENEEEGTEAGGDEEENDAEAEETETAVVLPKVKRKYVRKQKKTEQLEDKAFEEELSNLARSGLRNKNHTLSLCRLMVRAEKWEARERILNILIQGDTPCRRLFLDYHGLRLIWGWMLSLPIPTADGENNFESDNYHKLFLKTLDSLPIPNKTMLQDSKILSIIENWSKAIPVTTRIIKTIKPEVMEVQVIEPEVSDVTNQGVPEVNAAEVAASTKLEITEAIEMVPESTTSRELVLPDHPLSSSPLESTTQPHDIVKVEAQAETWELTTVKTEEPESMDIDLSIVKSEENIDRSSSETVSANLVGTSVMEDVPTTVTGETNEAGQEVDTVEEITWEFVNGSKDLLASWSGLQEVFRIPKKERVEQMKEHEREADKSDRQRTDSDKDRLSSYERDRGSSRYRGRIERRLSSGSDRDRVHRPRENFYRNRGGQTLLSSSEALEYPNLSKEERRNLFAAKVAKKEAEEQSRRMTEEMVTLHQDRCIRLGLDSTTTPIVDPSCAYYLDPSTVTWKEINLEDPTLPHVLHVIVQAAMFPPQMMFPPEPTIMELETTEEELFPPWPQGLLPPPPLPPAVLPKYWKMNVDDEGRCYYYDARTRRSQWTPPSPNSDLNSETEESAEETEEKTDSAGVTTSGDESGISATEDATADQTAAQKFQSWMTSRAERRKRTGLVTERLISPRSEEEKSLSFVSQSVIRENKLQASERKGKKVLEVECSDPSGAQHQEVKMQTLVVTGQSGNNVSQHEKEMEIDEDRDGGNGIVTTTPLPVPPPIQIASQKQLRLPEKAREKERVASPERQENSPGMKPTLTPMVQCSGQGLPDIEHLNLNESLNSNEEENEEAIPGLDSTRPFKGEMTTEDEEGNDNVTTEDVSGTSLFSKIPPTAIDSPSSITDPNCSEPKLSDRRTGKRRGHKKSKHGLTRARSTSDHDSHQLPAGISTKSEKERMSSDRKTKAANIEAFRSQIANVIVQHLNPYRKSNCKSGHISSTEDFKHLARKMTHAIALKEMKHSKDGKTIIVNESVKHKTKEYVKKYMGRFQGNYVRSPEDSQF